MASYSKLAAELKEVTGIMEQEIYSFTNETEKTLFNKISKELRCMVCQNQSLFDSRAPAALILRQEIYQQVRAGKTEQEITNTVVSQHGEAVLYQPAFKTGTFILWGGPVAMILIGCWLLKKILRS